MKGKKNSPYHGKQEKELELVTKRLINKHPLSTSELLELSTKAWDILWSTKIGNSKTNIPLKKQPLPSTIVGYFFEKLFARLLSEKYPNIWKCGEGSEKDIHCITNNYFSFEIKSSGQLGLKVFGNRSYGQKLENFSLKKKNKSGYYLTLNFYRQTLNLIRFGWIDFDDWKSQKASSGQAATLKDEVYRYKLMPVRGDYVLNGPLGLLESIGSQTALLVERMGFKTIKDVLNNKKKVNNKHFALCLRSAEKYKKTYGQA